MAQRVNLASLVSQADLDSSHISDVNSLFDIETTNIFNRQLFGDPFTLPPNPPNPNPAVANHQFYSNNYHLPSLPDLFADRPFPDTFDPFHVNSFAPRYRHHNPSSHTITTTNSHYQEIINPAPARPDPSFHRSNSNQSRQDRHSLIPTRPETPSVTSTRIQQSGQSSTTYNPYSNFPQPNRLDHEPTSDDFYLAALAEGNFSSPSLPAINSSPLPSIRTHSSGLPKPLEVGEGLPLTPSHAQRTNKAGPVDLTKEEPDLEPDVDPTTPTMPAARKRSAAALSNGEARPAASKRRRPSATSPSSSGRNNKSRSKQTAQANRAASPLNVDELLNGSADQDGPETIDLSNAVEVPEELKAPKVDNRIKLGQFQCVICMDDASQLTVTHCGHLFCSECLHTALHINNVKKTCPVCRTKIDPKEKRGKNLKSFYHLELKVMTATKKGKRPAGPS